MTKAGPHNTLTLLEGVRRFGLYEGSALLDEGTMFPKGSILIYGKREKQMPRGAVCTDDAVYVIPIVEYQLPSSNPHEPNQMRAVLCPTYVLEEEMKGRFHTGPTATAVAKKL